MPTFASSLATQIGFLVASLTKSNYNSVLYELSLLAEYGTAGSLIVLRSCLEQVNIREGEVQNLQLKIDLLAIVIRHLVHQPNFSTIFCEAVRRFPFSEALLEDLSEALKLSLLEQIGLGLALTDAEDSRWQQQGYLFCQIKLTEFNQTPGSVSCESIIDQILLFLHESEGLSKHIPAFVKALLPGAHTSLMLMPLLQDEVTDSGSLRRFDAISKSSCPISLDLMEQLENAVEAADIMEELGYSCTVGVAQCKEILASFPLLHEGNIARIIAMVARTYTGLEDSHGTFGTFWGAFNGSAFEDGLWPITWNAEVLVESIKDVAPGLDWGLVVDNLDHEGFYLPDQKAFNILMGIYGMACKDPFPIEKVCGPVWKNAEGQISFLRYAVLASPEVLSFGRSYSGQFPLESLFGTEMLPGSTNQAWLSIPLLEVLCQLAEMGHVGAVRSMLEHPLKHCPEILLLGVIQVKTTWNLIQHEILVSLFSMYLGGGLNSGTIFHQLWRLNSAMVIRGLLEVHSKDPTSILKILDVCQELQVLPQILESTPFSFSIDLAVSASRRDTLNLEKWLFDNLNNHRHTFFQACLRYLRERALAEARSELLGGSGHRSGLSASLPLEITATIFKVLQATPGHLVSRELLEEMKRVRSETVRVNPRLLSVGASASEQAASEIFPSDIEEESNSYFRNIYAGDLPIEKVVKMLEQFKESRIKRDQEIFACMIQSLFDEYCFFPKYPERELRITAILFGSLIKHQLVSSLTLGIALRYVLDALRKPLDSRMFSFGLAALEKFRDRLVEWPQYCNHILQISHMREAHGGLVEFIERALARLSSEPNAGHTLTPSETQTSSAQTSSMVPTVSIAENMEVSEAFSQMVSGSSDPQQQQTLQLQHIQSQPSGLHDEKIKSSSMTALSYTKPFVSAPNLQLQHSASTNQLFEVANTQKVSQPSQPGAFQVAPSPGFPRSTPTRSGGGFGHALNIETLVAAAERRDIQIEAPSSDVQDKIAFIINNISSANLDTKAKEFMEVLKEQYYPWFAQYMVMKRASIEPNFHDTYLKFLDKINSRVLHKEVVKATYENCKVLLRSDLIKSSSEERSLLKNLGSWLGKLTIGRNQALRAIEIDPKLLITEAYERGLMIAVIPFTSKILEPCQSSLAYQPPNPWTMGILGLLAEIYNLPNLKMNLKFDIEVLFKNLGVDMKDVKVSQLLKGRVREVEGNPDFSNKDVAIAHQSSLFTTESSSSSAAPMGLVDLPSEASVSASHNIMPSSSVSQVQLGTSHISASLTLPEEEKLAALALTERLPSGQGLSQTAGSPAPYSGNQLPMPLPNLSSYVVVNPKLAALGQQQQQLASIVSAAMDRAIREIISPVVDRSVTIACMTTRELVTKDYAMESDDSRIRHSGNLMVASLAGSLAHVTCKEPLRVAMSNHLRNLLQALNISGEMLEQAVLLVTNDNLDLGCAVIEKSATEKALRDLEEVIGPPLAHRRKQREAVGVTFYDVSLYSQGHLARLPEGLRPKPMRLSIAQQRVYEDFARLPWQNQPSQTTAVAPAGSAVPSNIPAVSGLARAGYTPSAQGLGSYVGMAGAQSAMGIGVVNQNLESTAEEIDHRMPSPLSHSSAGPVLVPDTGAHQALDTAPGLGNLASSAMFMDMTASERQPVLKDATPVPSTSASPPLPVDQVNVPPAEPSWTTGEAMEKFLLITQKLDGSVSRGLSMGLLVPSQDQELQALVMEIPEIISQCISKEEAALAFSQKAFRRLYENASSSLHVATYLALLASIRDVCKRVVKEITSWVMYSDEERKYNREIMVGLIRSELIHLADYNVYLAKLIDGGRNSAATEFAIYLVQTCVVQDNVVGAIELCNVIETLGKVAQRPGSESLQRLVDLAKNASSTLGGQSGSISGKEDKARPTKEKRPSSSRGSALREESKAISKDSASVDPAGLPEQVTMLFDEWATIWDTSGTGNNDKTYAVYISKLQHLGMLKGDDITDRFFRILMELAVARSLNLEAALPGAAGIAFQQQGVSFAAIDTYAKLVVLLVKYYGVDPSMAKVNLLNKVLSVTVRVIQKVSDEKKSSFHPRPYFRLFVMWLMDFNAPDPLLDASNFQVLTAFANTFMQLQPLRIPGWSFAWLELISHRMFMPKLLLINSQKGWPLVQRLLVALFKFMEPYLRNADLSEPVRLLYKGTLRVLLVLLHDFPEFLCDNHFSFCDVIPPSCIQMRNLILSAFPRNMRLPDPFTPNLKVDLLPEISQSPRILSDVEFSLKNKQLKSEIDDYLKTRQPLSLLLADLKQRLMLPQPEVSPAGTRYNVPLINALVLYVGMQAIQQLQSKTTPQQLAVPTAPITHSAPMDIFQRLIVELDTEGRYLFLNAVANQLRYPNNHTHYFSCVLLYLFAEANQEIIQEQITRVLLERLIVNRPHPWGLLITFIELIKNPRYNFWSHGFTRCAPEIEKLFESVARSCMGPPIKAVDDDLASTIAAEGMKA